METAWTNSQMEVSRPFVFAELFSGMGGLSLAMETLSAGRVKVCATLDEYDGWDILDDKHYEAALDVCSEVDHCHFAPPCRSLTRARRSDEHGVSKVLRSDECPEGWGDKEAVEGNAIAARTVMLILRLLTRGRTFSVENPWDSFIWLLSVFKRLFKRADTNLVKLEQCVYGAVTPKPTGILTNADWMKMVCGLCCEQAPHYHLKGGLVGMVWDYGTNEQVWRTSLAAEYPCGLTVAWTNSLLSWLSTDAGRLWLAERTYVRIGRWRNTIVRAAKAVGGDVEDAVQTASQKREKENRECVGGLRNPRRCVTRSTPLRKVGERARGVVDRWLQELDDKPVELVRDSLSEGIPDEMIQQLKHRLAAEFKADVTASGLQAELWSRMLKDALDADADVLPRWMVSGFPLGIENEITYTGIFPKTEEDTAAVESSRMEGLLMQDFEDECVNYQSFQEAGHKAQELLDKLLHQDRAELFTSWNDVVNKFGNGARLTKMACIVKTKEDGSEKVRLVVDCRRSGVNGLMTVRERVVLPRVSDVADSLKRLLWHNSNYRTWPCLMSADFSDAFYMAKLMDSERKYVITKGMPLNGRPRYYCMKVVTFGLAPGPLLWARLASAAMRLSQAMARPWESEVHCFVDDPLIVSMASSFTEHARIHTRCLALWRALGLEVAWHKADCGNNLQWIGFHFEIGGPEGKDLTVQLTEQKRSKLQQVFEDILKSKGVVAVQKLQYAVGVLGWLTSAVPVARPWMAMLWAALTKHRDPVRSTTRVRKGLIFLKQVDNAIRWLGALLHPVPDQPLALQKTFRWRPHAPEVLIQTDACPGGMGGFIQIGNQFVAYFHDALNELDFRRFGASPGDPAFQSEYELLALLVALKVFQHWIIGNYSAASVTIRTDNMAVVAAAFEYRASSPIMVQLTAEVMLQLESMGVSHHTSQHVPGLLNDIADKLSRHHEGYPVPHQLVQCRLVQVPQRTDDFYRAWPK